MRFNRADPTTIVLDAIEVYRLTACDRGVSLCTELPKDLPVVWADSGQVVHVFANLLTNALRYTGAGGSVTVAAKADEERVFFSVSDTGKGIPSGYLDTVFDKFFRVPDQEKNGGAGLGLAIVKEIVEAHGGTVSVESWEGKGSVFTFSLRRADRTAQRETD